MAHSPDPSIRKTNHLWPEAQMEVAAIVGHATPKSVRLWLRAGRSGEFSLLLYRYPRVVISPSDGTEAEKTLQATLSTVPLTLEEADSRLPEMQCKDFEVEDSAADTTTVLDLTDLESNTRYGYALYDRSCRRIVLGQHRLRWFRTLPPESEQRPFQFALLSCHMPYVVKGLSKKRTEVRNLKMWDFLNTTLRRHADEVDLVIAAGDQCYSDGVKTLDLWKELNRKMQKKNGRLLPDKEEMLSWYRDIYRGYWGFESVQRVFDSFPTYMIWDDHEIVDGWGSYYFDSEEKPDGQRRLLPDLKKRGLTDDEGQKLAWRMFCAARQAYMEYEHSHNPCTAQGDFDYHFQRGGCAFYVLDGRGHRNIKRKSYRILGKKQFDRFANWIKGLDHKKTPFLFVVSAVPVLPPRATLFNAFVQRLINWTRLGDDLRDSWVYEQHKDEREALMKELFSAAGKGIRVAILSGDAHVSAAFVLKDKRKRCIYQLTSSAITNKPPRAWAWLLRRCAPDNGETAEGYRFERLALCTENSYALIKADPQKRKAWFQLYGKQKRKASSEGTDTKAIPVAADVATVSLFGEG